MGQRSALLLRLAVLGATLLVGVAVLVARGGAEHEALPAKSQLSGRTSQGYPVYGVQVGGAMRMVHAVWRGASCTKGRSLKWAVDNVDAAFLPFSRDGRAFSAVYRRHGYSLRGLSPHETLAVSGRLAADRRSAYGMLHGRVVFSKGGREAGTCDSGPVRWRLAAAG